MRVQAAGSSPSDVPTNLISIIPLEAGFTITKCETVGGAFHLHYAHEDGERNYKVIVEAVKSAATSTGTVPLLQGFCENDDTNDATNDDFFGLSELFGNGDDDDGTHNDGDLGAHYGDENAHGGDRGWDMRLFSNPRNDCFMISGMSLFNSIIFMRF